MKTTFISTQSIADATRHQMLRMQTELAKLEKEIVTGRVQDNAARYWMCDIVMIPGAALLKFPAPHVLFWYPALLAYYTAQVAVLRRRPGVAVKGMLVALRLLPKFLRERNPIPVSQYQLWRAVRGEQQRTYLQRTGRWRWYHEVLPALG